MLITFLASSRFHPALATRYCGGPVDANGHVREEVRVLRGSPEQFEQTAVGLTYQEKYKSAVLAFAPEDDPSEEEVQALLEEFLDLCFAGLARERFAVVAYLHRSATKVDMHVLIAKVDLWTNKQINVAPPGWERDFDPLQDAWNWRKGWARPGDPRRARALQPGPRSPADAARLRAKLPVSQDSKVALTEMLLAKVQAGSVKNRTDIIAALSEVGTITRDPADSISVRLKGASKNLRLKGVLYMANFDAASFLAPRPPIGSKGAAKSTLDVDPEKEREARVLLAEAMERRKIYNLRRFRLRVKRRMGMEMGPSEDLMAALTAAAPSTPLPPVIPDASDTTQLSFDAAHDAQPAPPGLTSSPKTDRDPIQPTVFNHGLRKRVIYDRATHLFHALLEDLVTGVHERLQEFAGAIRKAAGRLVATGRAIGAQAAVARAEDSEARNPGGSKERVTSGRKPSSSGRAS